MTSARQIRLFVSSPSDVEPERLAVGRVADKLNKEFAEDVARIETIRWETEYYSAHQPIQPQIPEAADCDIVIAILWWRLGSDLPTDFKRMPTGGVAPERNRL